MEHSDSSVNSPTKQSSWVLISIIIVVILSLFVWFFIKDDPIDGLPIAQEPVIDIKESELVAPESIVEPVDELEPEALVIEIPAVEIELEPIEPLPVLDNSDSWLQEKLSTLTWRKELLKLVIDEDMIRRLVVFTDNFSQGDLAYNHSPFVLPQTKFSAIETKEFDQNNQQAFYWDPKTEQRFELYLDLLRSFDTEKLVDWYIEIKPLIDEAYAELGYPDDDFTDTLLDAITRVLDMELPKEPLKIIRPSVMYKYQDKEIESLSDTEKLLLRLGRENVLVIKSVLLEFSEKLSRKESY